MHTDNLYSHTLKTAKQQYTPCRMLLDNICQYRDKHALDICKYSSNMYQYNADK